MSHSQQTKCLGLVGLFTVALIVAYYISSDSLYVPSTSRSKVVKESQTSPTTIKNSSRVSNFPVPKDEIYDKLATLGGNRSMDHQRKFLARRMLVPTMFDISRRYQPLVRKYAAIKLTKQFAFLHIWKCGGTTVQYLLGENQLPLSDEEIQRRKWMALLRDPIDRFLSAWAECGVRLYEGQINFNGNEKYSTLKWLNEEYDYRVRAFLREVKDYLPPERSCHTHAFPQANFMMNSTGHIDDHIRLVGDLSEMRIGLQAAGLRLGELDMVVRDANDDLVKKYYFQSKRELLSKETLLELCDFYALDYYLFDFDPPAVCLEPNSRLAML